jgi:putative sporulation protein YyaC
MPKTYIHIDSDDCLETLTQSITQQIQNVDKAYDEICVACIGSDKVLGDCVGPLVGTKLSNVKSIKVKGSLEETLHAMNLKQYVSTLSPKQLVIAVDACLGPLERVGHIVVDSDSIAPGAGVGKRLPSIGDLSIKAIIGAASDDIFSDMMTMQKTKLSFIMKMSDIIAEGLRVALSS